MGKCTAFKLSAEQEVLLRRWVLTANAKGRYSRGSTETMLDQDLQTIRTGGGVAGLLERLRLQVGRLDVAAEELQGRTQRSALFKTMFLAFRQAGAKDWESNVALSLKHKNAQQKLQFHHIVPKALMKQSHKSREVDDIANLAFISGRANGRISAKPPAIYLHGVVANSRTGALKAQCIPLEEPLWQTTAYEVFLGARRELIAKRLNEFLEGESDSPGKAEVHDP